MPNWCENTLTIKGNIDKIKDFLKDGFQANRFIKPDLTGISEKFDALSPEEKKRYTTIVKLVAGDEEAHENAVYCYWFNHGGYQWCIENWGTKWDWSQPTVLMRKRSAVLWFDTAWSPPLPVIQKASSMHPDLTFSLKYKEEGMGFSGSVTYKDGEE
jgi:hypothetical protein